MILYYPLGVPCFCQIPIQAIGINKQIIKREFAMAIVGRGHDPADPVPVFDLVR